MAILGDDFKAAEHDRGFQMAVSSVTSEVPVGSQGTAQFYGVQNTNFSWACSCSIKPRLKSQP
jgi:hypothetical protein